MTKQASEINHCLHCGRELNQPVSTEYGQFCNEYHYRVWKRQNTGFFRRIRNAWVRAHD